MTHPSLEQRQKKLGTFKRLRHLELLIALVGIIVGQALLNDTSNVNRTVFNLLFFTVVISAMRSLSQSRWSQLFAIITGVIALSASMFAEFQPSRVLLMAVYACYLAIFLSLVYALSRSVFQSGRIDTNQILGAVCIYFLLALIWALVYSMIEVWRPHSFNIPDYVALGVRQQMVCDMIYFSNVTLTTLGYGDILPLSNLARTLANLEAMAGQLYVAIVIARMVGVQVTQRPEHKTLDNTEGKQTTQENENA
jgi:drug/metabolite transporter (DMT)-like permease